MRLFPYKLAQALKAAPHPVTALELGYWITAIIFDFAGGFGVGGRVQRFVRPLVDGAETQFGIALTPVYSPGCPIAGTNSIL